MAKPEQTFKIGKLQAAMFEKEVKGKHGNFISRSVSLCKPQWDGESRKMNFDNQMWLNAEDLGSLAILAQFAGQEILSKSTVVNNSDDGPAF